jgi:hypothetical protein
MQVSLLRGFPSLTSALLISSNEVLSLFKNRKQLLYNVQAPSLTWVFLFALTCMRRIHVCRVFFVAGFFLETSRAVLAFLVDD